MKRFNLHNIRLVLIFGLLLFLVGFANHRQRNKPIKSMQIELLDASKIFITEAEVEDLMKEVLKSTGDSIYHEEHLAIFENKLNANEMIKSSEAFYTLDGVLSAKIVQREPIARIIDEDFYYLDADGKLMPLSKNYSSRVPLVSGVDSTDLKELYSLLIKIEADEFLKKHIIAIRKNAKKSYILEVRDKDYVVNFGQISYIDLKLANYKVFYSKASEYNKIDDYNRIDLQFGNQVVCTTK